MGERLFAREDMATTSTAVSTVQPLQEQEPVEAAAVITLRNTRAKQRDRKRVVWTDDTVDNENMNKKKSKCCCIYEKPHKFGESDSEDSDDECEHCFGHVERRRPNTTTTDTQDSPAPEPPASISLPPSDPSPPTPPDRPQPS